MQTIDIKGPVVDSDTGIFMDFIQEKCISPAKVTDALKEANGDDVQLAISSRGGDVYVGAEIYTILKQYPGKVTGVIQGLAASAASVIAEACDHLVISPVAQMMIHRTSTDASGNKNDMEYTAEVLDTADQSIVNAYVNKTGKKPDAILKMLDKGTYLTAQQAVEQGFADEILSDKSEVPLVLNSLDDQIPNPDAVRRILPFIKDQEDRNKPQEKKNKEDTKITDSAKADSDLFMSKLKLLKGE